MRILRSKRHGGREAVVDLVDGAVQGPDVEEAVSVVEHGLAEKAADDEVGDEFLESREGGRDEEGGFRGEEVRDEGEADGDELVAEGDEEAVADFGGAGLFGRRLEFVAGGEGGEVGVYGDVDCGGDPEEEELDEKGAVEFDVVGRVGVDDVGPGGGEPLSEGEGGGHSEGVRGPLFEEELTWRGCVKIRTYKVEVPDTQRRECEYCLSLDILSMSRT